MSVYIGYRVSQGGVKVTDMMLSGAKHVTFGVITCEIIQVKIRGEIKGLTYC